ncbi:unnamed protein product, partial [Vitis vinifera]|uniref:beta-N-acetylhexosaminidase n=1 Tax=Vitis vinifera TaxID=29760 RepID=D7TG06_VITVI
MTRDKSPSTKERILLEISCLISGCWTETPHIRKWLRQHGLDTSGAYQYFVLRAQKIALSHGYEIINWEETFNDFGSKLSRKTVVHNWYDLIVTCIICIFHYGINFIFCHKYTLHWCGFI